ncbi:MAG: GTPase RsgA, partial [Bacillota bacterium]
MFKKLGINKIDNIDDLESLGRVVGQYRDLYKIYTNDGEIIATLSGSSYHNSNKSEFPVVGDWVKYERYNEDSNGIINKVYERKSVLSRKQAGKKEEEQIIAANIDIIFIVTSLNHDFNPRRLERYLTIAWDSGAKPIIILNKSDLCENVSEYIKEVEKIAFNTPYIITSCVSETGLEEVKEVIK